MITKLAPNEVFVFGSNAQGFHGAGAAGYAFCGHTRNDWRTCPAKQAAIAAHKKMQGGPWRGGEVRDPRIGHWNIWGCASGFQRGYEGMSCAIVTVEKPGGPKVNQESILFQFQALLRFAKCHPEYDVLMTEVGCGLGGHDKTAMRNMLEHSVKVVGLPLNFKNYETVYL